jgi:hypothetical protein
MGQNGRSADGLPIIGGRQIPRVKVKFDGEMLRGMLKAITDQAEINGGAIPMPDPAGMLAVGLVMERLDNIVARLDKIEQALSVSQDIAEAHAP